MPSAALLRWQNDRVVRLLELEVQHSTTLAIVPPRASLADENLRGFVVLLSAHFQGFCRDLYTEASALITAVAPSTLRLVLQSQCAAQLKLKHNNPTFDHLAEDFDRFGFDLKTALTTVVGNAVHVNHLAILNKWRNFIAHHGTLAPPGPPLTLASAQNWKNSCEWLAVQLDGIMYTQLLAMIGTPPW
jgi:hypothetical protein